MLIYLITNTINDKKYIGQTTGSFKDRYDGYKSTYKCCKIRRPIIDAMVKYGFENFTFEIVEDNISNQEALDEAERKYIIEYDTLITNGKGYNVELGGNGIGKHSEETKEKIGASQKGNLNHRYGKSGKEDWKSKPCVDLSTGKVYDSANLAAIDLNINFSHICATCRGTRASTDNRVFRYLDENNNIILPEKRAKIKAFKTLENVLPEYRQYI